VKVNFKKSVPFTPEWNDNKKLPEADQLHLTLSPLDVGEALHLMATLQDGGFDSGEVKTLKVEQSKALIESCGKYIPAHVTEVRGNEDFDMEDVVKYLAFMTLAAEILFKLIEISQPTEQDVKNLKPQPASA
jgi:hypothetical protein